MNQNEPTPGQHFRNARLALCLKQKEIAYYLGVTTSAVCHYERDVRHPDLTILRKLIEMAEKKGIILNPLDFMKQHGERS